MAGLKEFYCRLNETSLGSQFKWLEYTFKGLERMASRGLFPLLFSQKFYMCFMLILT